MKTAAKMISRCCALVAIAALLISVSSCFVGCEQSWRARGILSNSISISGGYLDVVWSENVGPTVAKLEFKPPAELPHPFWSNPGDQIFSMMGVACYSGPDILFGAFFYSPRRMVVIAFREVVVSLWMVSVLLSLPEASCIVLAGIRRKRRDRQGYCVRCGYDLRGSLERCPECGNVVKGEAVGLRR